MSPDVSYIPCVTSWSRKTGNMTTFVKFEEGSLLYETRDNVEIGDEYDDNSTISPWIIEEEMDAMDSGNGSEDELMSTEMLEDICDSSKSHTIENRREAR